MRFFVSTCSLTWQENPSPVVRPGGIRALPILSILHGDALIYLRSIKEKDETARDKFPSVPQTGISISNQNIPSKVWSLAIRWRYYFFKKKKRWRGTRPVIPDFSIHSKPNLTRHTSQQLSNKFLGRWGIHPRQKGSQPNNEHWKFETLYCVQIPVNKFPSCILHAHKKKNSDCIFHTIVQMD